MSPRDGIDDKRHDLLLGLAVRFAPYMVRNTTNIPMDFKGFITRRPSFPLYVDTWDVATARGHLLRTDIVDFAALARAPCGSASPARNAARPSDPHDDCRLLDLLHRFGPGGSAADTAAHTAEAPEQDLLHIFYFDFPGQDAASWKAEFENLVSGELPRRYETFAKVYAHPFIHEVADGLEVGAAYEFVLQYWFFYPYNDSGNKHEGDWEHVNVVAGLRDHPGAPLNAAELRDLLAGAVSQDRLVIRRVEYYFHHNVYLIDYTTPNVYQPRAAWAAEVGRMRPERLGEARVWAQIRNRAYTDRAETRVNTHPLVYIGGDNKGLDQILALPGGSNRDSHASYPLPGLYKDIGPTGASEEITHGVDFHDVIADSTRGALDRVIRFDDPAKIELVPDWEPVLPLVLSDPDVRREWSWLVLPIQWGYPATKSPFAGVVKHVDTGNLSPLSPSYNSGWNRTGPAPGYYLYEPHLFSSLFAGVFGVSVGVSTNYLGDDFAGLLLLPDQADDIDSIIRRTDSTTKQQSARVGKAVSTYGALHLYVGHRFVSENSLRHSHAALEADFVLPSQGRAGAVTGDLEMWEYAGSVRYNLRTEAVQPFLLFGYGLSWYRLTQIAFDGQALNHPETPWVRRPDPGSLGTLLPNTWHLGAGLEVIPIRSYAPIPRGIDVGIRVDCALYFHRLGLQSLQSRGIFVPVPDPGVTRRQINSALTVSF